MLLADDFAWTGIPGGAPVFGHDDLFKAIQLADSLEPVVNQLPRAGSLGIHFAVVLGRSAARSVQQSLRATRHRADTTELCQHAIAAAQTFFVPDCLLLKNPQELGVEPGINRFLRKPFRNCLHSGTAGEGYNGLYFGNRFRQLFQKLVVALPFNCNLAYFNRFAVQFARHSYCVGRNTDFAFATGETYGHSGSATDE